MIRSALIALLLASATPVAAAPVEGGIEVTRQGTTLSVVALTPSILRVRYRAAGTAMPDEPSWAVLPDVRARRAAVTPRSNGFATANLTVSIDPDSLHLTVRRADGSILSDDVDAGFERRSAGFTIRKTMAPGTAIYGMGDKTGGLDRNGKTFVNWNTDSYGFDDATDPLYKSIPFYIATSGGRSYGLFLDNSFRSSFDFGHAVDGRIAIAADGGQVDYYLIDGPTLAEVTRGYASLTGTAPMPPRWALGYQQSRYSYMTEREVRDLVARFDAERFPLDAVWLDIDYQDRNRPFTVDRKAFPNFERMIADLSAARIATIPIVDLHIAHAPGEAYAPYDSGLAGDHFLKNADGSLYIAPVWPGPSVFPDFTRQDTRRWWGTLYAPLAKAGVAGIWNDMNEPAIFDTPSKTMPLDTRHRIAGDGRTGRTVDHREVHNIYGMENSRATYEGLLGLRPNVRPFVMTRASYAGGQRYAVTWTGDNSSTWAHLKLSVAQTINLGLSGFAWTGVDVGGFIGGASPDLMTRWFQYASFMPIFRDHSAKGAPRAEPWVDGPAHLTIRRRFVEERYRLLPYLVALAAEAERTGNPLVRPIGYDDPEAKVACDPAMSFTLGKRILISGNPTPESPKPYAACLPGGDWYDYWTGRRVDRSAEVTITPSIDTLPVFVRAGSIIPRQGAVRRTADLGAGPLELHVYPGPDCAGELYDDDGISRTGPARRQQLRCTTLPDGTVRIQFEQANGRFAAPWTSVVITVHGGDADRVKRIALPTRPTTVDIAAR